MLIYDIVIKEVDGVVRLAFNPTSGSELQATAKERQASHDAFDAMLAALSISPSHVVKSVLSDTKSVRNQTQQLKDKH